MMELSAKPESSRNFGGFIVLLFVCIPLLDLACIVFGIAAGVGYSFTLLWICLALAFFAGFLGTHVLAKRFFKKSDLHNQIVGGFCGLMLYLYFVSYWLVASIAVPPGVQTPDINKIETEVNFRCMLVEESGGEKLEFARGFGRKEILENKLHLMGSHQ